METDRKIYALTAMSSKAEALGVKGVAALLITPKGNEFLGPFFKIVDRFERDPKPEGGTDTGTNYLAVVWSKIAEMLSTRLDSGKKDRPNKTGELGFEGGLIVVMDGTILLTAFSGGTPEQDTEIARAGMDVLLQKPD